MTVRLDWRRDSWRVLPASTWPQPVRRPDGRVHILPPKEQPPPCRYCGDPAHLLDDDRRPAHKVCVEHHLTRRDAAAPAARRRGQLTGEAIDGGHP